MGDIFKGDGKAILVVFIGAIIAAVLLASVANQVVGVTTTVAAINSSFTLCNSVNCTTDLTGRQLVSGATITVTNGTVTTRILIRDGADSGGLRTVQALVNDTAFAELYGGDLINVTYTYEPDGFVGGSTGTITTLITLFGAFAALIFVIVVFIKDGSMGRLIRGDR